MGVRQASEKRKKPIKLLIFGDSSVGKTHFLLSAPSPLVCDTESGTDLFEGKDGLDFLVWEDDAGMKTTSVKELRKAMEYVTSKEGRKRVKTFCIDPYSQLYDDIQIQRQDYKEEKKKYNSSNEADIATFTTIDWMTIKKLHKSIMVDLVNLPTNVIVSCREKEVNEVLANGDVRKTGEYTYDGEKNMKYLFDVVLRLTFDPKTGKRQAIVMKSRVEDKLPLGKIIDNPTFAIFDNIINGMADAKVEAKGIAKNENENIFREDSPEEKDESFKEDLSDAISKLRANKDKLSEEERKEILGSAPGNNPNKITTAEEARIFIEAVEKYCKE